MRRGQSPCRVCFLSRMELSFVGRVSFFFFSSRRRHTRLQGDWSSDVCSSDLMKLTRELEFRIERKLYRQGKIVGGVYVGRGQEAIAVGSCIDLRQDDVVCPSHRDMGAYLIRGMTIRTILAQYMARKTGATKGKDGNMHMGDLSKGLIAFVSMLGDNVPVAAGIGLSFKMRGQDRVALCFFGDGATSRGDWHEGIRSEERRVGKECRSRWWPDH